MSPRAWRIRTRSRWRGTGSNWWLYPVTLAILIWAGVHIAIWGEGVLPGGLGWVAWVIFGCWWVPTSLGASKWLAAGMGYLFALPGRLFSFPERAGAAEHPERVKLRTNCPHCGAEVEADRAVCSHCYQDLKTNCASCGAIVPVNSRRCAQCGASLPEPNEARR